MVGICLLPDLAFRWPVGENQDVRMRLPSGKRNGTPPMANEYVVDAHALIWFLSGNQRLGSRALGVL